MMLLSLCYKRFGKPQQIMTAHMDKLLRIQGYIGDRPSLLRSIFNKIMVQVCGLESFGIQSAQYGSLLFLLYRIRQNFRGGKLSWFLRFFTQLRMFYDE